MSGLLAAAAINTLLRPRWVVCRRSRPCRGCGSGGRDSCARRARSASARRSEVTCSIRLWKRRRTPFDVGLRTFETTHLFGDEVVAGGFIENIDGHGMSPCGAQEQCPSLPTRRQIKSLHIAGQSRDGRVICRVWPTLQVLVEERSYACRQAQYRCAWRRSDRSVRRCRKSGMTSMVRLPWPRVMMHSMQEIENCRRRPSSFPVTFSMAT